MEIDPNQEGNLGDASIETLKEAVNELEKRKRQDPLEHVYEPHQFQEKIHQSRAETTLVVGGNRTGKSWGAVAEALFYALGRGEYAEIPEPPNIVWYVMPSGTMFERSIKPIFRELCPPDKIASSNQKYNRWTFTNGSEIHFLSADMRQRRLQGASIDFVVMDEAMNNVIHEELEARVLDRGGRILMVLTPVDEDASKWTWIRDEIYIPWKTGEKQHTDVIHMPVADPETGEPLVPHFTRSDIERMERQWPDPQVRAVRMYGEFITRAGLVFKGFDEDVHMIDPFMIPPNWHEWMICDPQYHRFAVLMFAADEKGNYYVTDEYFSQDEELAYRAERIKAMVGHRDRDVPMYVDYANPQDIAELNYHFNRVNAPIGAMELPMQKRVDKMILRVHSMLESDKDRMYHPQTNLENVYGAPRLMFFNDLESTWEENDRKVTRSRLLWEIKRLTWDSKGKPDKASAGGGDASDCLIYGCSIMAKGAQKAQDDEWKKGLDYRDVKIHEIMEQQDKIEKINRSGGGQWFGARSPGM